MYKIKAKTRGKLWGGGDGAEEGMEGGDGIIYKIYNDYLSELLLY